jgi:putative heme-binding domain-containing protein
LASGFLEAAGAVRRNAEVKTIILLLALSATCTGLVRAQLANLPTEPHWMELEAGTRMERQFDQETPLLMAVLLVAADTPVEIRINGDVVGQASDPAKAVSLDVTKRIKPGANTLVLSAAKKSRVAALLELNGDLNRKTWLATDASWKASEGKVLTGQRIQPNTPDNPFDFKKTFDAYNSWQLAKADAQSAATTATDITVPPGFEVDLVRSAKPDEGSWVAMAFDPSGRITLAREKKGLLRLTLSGSGEQKMETIEDSLLECRGLLYAHGALFANANNSKALYKLEDSDADGLFEKKTELLRTEGGVGHGRNHIKLGPDGRIYIAHGNNVLLPKQVSADSPLKNYADDQLIPNPWDGSMFDGTVELPAGHVLSIAPEGGEATLIAGGLRNPLDIAFHRDGALLTFDADMERDVGTHFYMPTRVLHIVPGADYGWRRGTGRWPSWYVDTLPSVVDVGLSSPTAIFFGYGAAFPKGYQDALYLCDWSYGRIIAVHLTKQGESYTGRMETFASGRPLNLTDGAIGPDGAMWFITGGRSTQSGLYRIKAKPEAKEPAPLVSNPPSVDRFALHRQRMAIEKAGDFTGPTGSSEVSWKAAMQLTACARSTTNSQLSETVTSALAYLASMDVELQLAGLRIIEIALSRGHPLDAKQRANLVTEAEARFPAKDARFSRELCKFLVYLKATSILEAATQHLKTLSATEDLVYYPFMLRYLKGGWSLDQRRTAFEALRKAEGLNGASTYFKVLQDTRSELAAALTPAEATQLAAVIHPPQPAKLLPTALPGHSYREWKIADLVPHLDEVKAGRSFEIAKSAMVTAQCVFCHKVSNDPNLPAGIAGPDLTQVRSRFSARDLLMHILEPSKVVEEKFRILTLTKTDDTEVSGVMESEDDERVTLRPNLLSPEVIEVGKSQLKSRRSSDISSMPPGLLNPLKQEAILDLLGWFEANGDPASTVWQR